MSSYTSRIHTDPVIRTAVDKHIANCWWSEVCHGANKPEFHGRLFEPNMFDEDGLLDIDHPAFGKLLRVLRIAYAHALVNFYPATTPTDWHPEWRKDKEGAVFLAFRTQKSSKGFAMSTPKGGYLDSKAELAVLRAKRDGTAAVDNRERRGAVDYGRTADREMKQAEVRKRRAQAYAQSVREDDHAYATSAAAVQAGPPSPSKMPENNAHGEPEPEPESEEDCEIISSSFEDSSGEDIFKEARREVKKDDQGYVYDPKDSKKPKRWGWF